MFYILQQNEKNPLCLENERGIAHDDQPIVRKLFQ